MDKKFLQILTVSMGISVIFGIAPYSANDAYAGMCPKGTTDYLTMNPTLYQTEQEARIGCEAYLNSRKDGATLRNQGIQCHPYQQTKKPIKYIWILCKKN